MGRIVIALALISLAAAGCAGSKSEPSGKLSVVVTYGTEGVSDGSRQYTLTCGPAGGTMPDREAACGALADYLKHRSDPGRFCSSLGPGLPKALVTGTFDDHACTSTSRASRGRGFRRRDARLLGALDVPVLDARHALLEPASVLEGHRAGAMPARLGLNRGQMLRPAASAGPPLRTSRAGR